VQHRTAHQHRNINIMTTDHVVIEKERNIMKRHLPSSAPLSDGAQLTANDSESNLKATEPSAARMAVAIAGYPYNIRTAINDIIDNPIENGATKIAVMLKNTGPWEKTAVVIVDNGTGIAPEIIDEVLRPGSYTADRYSENSLSRYGIGLKGAGLSLGHRIVVLTKFAGQELRRRAIDIRVIQEKDKWVQEIRNSNKAEGDYFEWAMRQLPGAPDKSESGTVVIIDDLNIRTPDINRITREVIYKCGETYSRFLSAKLPQEERLQISVDGHPILAVDPLHREDKRTTVLYDREEIKLGDTSVFFSATLLPHPNQLDKDTRQQYRYKTPNQGIYIFRNNRLIASGETLGLFTREGHLNAFRGELVYTTNADEHILVDVAKSALVLSQEATSELQKLVENCTRAANALWRQYDVLTEEDIKGLFDESNRLIESRINLLAKKTVSPKTGKVNTAGPRTARATPTKPASAKKDVNYLVPVGSLPDGMLYCPRFENGSVQVDVSLSHPFSKAVFSGSASETKEAKKNVPRKATTAVQQLIYILGLTEFMFPEQDPTIFDLFRRHASLNLTGLLAD
jgi:hypothetical protein